MPDRGSERCREGDDRFQEDTDKLGSLSLGSD